MNSLVKLVRNNKSKTLKNNKSGVFQLICDFFPKVYVGQTVEFLRNVSQNKNGLSLMEKRIQIFRNI